MKPSAPSVDQWLARKRWMEHVRAEERALGIEPLEEEEDDMPKAVMTNAVWPRPAEKSRAIIVAKNITDLSLDIARLAKHLDNDTFHPAMLVTLEQLKGTLEALRTGIDEADGRMEMLQLVIHKKFEDASEREHDILAYGDRTKRERGF